MSHTGRYGNIDYPMWAKRSFLLGVSLFLIGAVGEFTIVQTQQNVPEWVHTLLVDLELLGVLIALVLPILFAIVLPLTE